MSNATLRVVNYAEKMASLKEQIDDLAEQKTTLQKEYDELRFKGLPDAMDEAGIESMRIKGLGTVYLVDDLNVSIPDKDTTYAWLDEHGYGDIVKPYIFPQTVKAFVKEQMREGNELPDGLFKTSMFVRAQIKSS